MNVNLRKIEPALLFAVIFLPGFLTQAVMTADPEMFNNGVLLFFYIITALPQALLILYFIFRDKHISPEIYGIRSLNLKTIVLSIPALGGVFLMLIPIFILNAVIYLFGEFPQLEGVDWRFTNFSLFPVVLISCLVTGYLEELYFRSYLTTRMTFEGIPRTKIIILVNILFAAGHLYQGIAGLAGTFIIGIYLTFLFFKSRNIHLIAITHGLYNFSILILSSFIE